MKSPKIAVAMSGGVDSSVAAALMCEKYGKENVFGVTAKLFCYEESGALRQVGGVSNKKACCSLEAIDDARAVCDNLKIPHYVIDEESEFQKTVIKNFIEAYKHGQTPIPCIPCNTHVKFGSMLKKVKALGAERLATGHYAKIATSNKQQASGYQLLRGVDREKDQTYFLYGLGQEQLAQIEFPIGGLSKKEVRALAKKIGLKTAEKKESQGVCFVTEERVTDFLADKIKSKPGNIKNTKGEIVGAHDGYIFYTIGQRKRIGGGHKEPMFVVGINPIENEVIIGAKKELYKKELSFNLTNWINEITLPLSCTAKIRYNMNDAKCIIKHQIPNTKYQTKSKLIQGSKIAVTDTNSNGLEVKRYIAVFSKSQRAITPGQSIVFYKGEVCIGGGVIIGPLSNRKPRDVDTI